MRLQWKICLLPKKRYFRFSDQFNLEVLIMPLSWRQICSETELVYTIDEL